MSSLFTVAELNGFWTIAAKPVPVLIVGGGRWARVWASVIAQARNTGADILVASKHAAANPPEWMELRARFPDIKIVSSAAEAFGARPDILATIIASRPQDHVRDGLEAVNFGSNVLIEKPLSPSVLDGRILVEAARKRGRVLALGTEFSFLPACHALHPEIILASNDGEGIHLIWNDPPSELRHGAVKARHTEVSLLADLLPHAASIFRIFSGAGNLDVVGAELSNGRSKGTIDFRDRSDRRYRLEANVEADGRTRLLQAGKMRSGTQIDFSAPKTVVVINGEARELEQGLSQLESVMRLELGAFIDEIENLTRNGGTGTIAQEMLVLQEQLEKILSRQISDTSPLA